MKKLSDDCFLHDKDRMKHSEAIALLKERMEAIVDVETTSLSEAYGRILAKDLTAPRNIPAFDNSAVDGYAYAFEDHSQTKGYFPVSARIVAGNTKAQELKEGSAARIFTGAQMPSGADTIAMQEDCTLETKGGEAYVAIPAGLKRGANCRLAGEDVQAGSVIATAGSRLNPATIAAIASTGTDQLKTTKPLKVGLLSSGDEILRPGMPFEGGKVYDANHFMLKSLLDTPWIETSDLGVCPDTADKVDEILQQACQSYDVVVTTGGASRGEEDHFVSALDRLGNCHMWQIAVKPGRPMSFGQVNSMPCFTLPGNPVAAFVCCLLYVRPALYCLAGGEWKTAQRFQLPASFDVNSKPDRREFLRGYLETSATGITSVAKFERDGSGLISGLRKATGLIEIPETTTRIQPGDQVDFIPFSELLD